MNPIFALLAFASASLQPDQAGAQNVAPREEASIPFVRSNGILDWRADGDRALYIRGGNGAWYRAETMGACGRLRSAITIGFETRSDQLDRYGVLLVEGWRCPLSSVVRSDPPPRSTGAPE
jgi:hypothetical protein